MRDEVPVNAARRAPKRVKPAARPLRTIAGCQRPTHWKLSHLVTDAGTIDREIPGLLCGGLRRLREPRRHCAEPLFILLGAGPAHSLKMSQRPIDSQRKKANPGASAWFH